MTKPVLLLDVDGVVNALTREFPLTWPEDTWWQKDVYAPSTGRSWPITYSTALVDALNDISERAEVRWHTTWQYDAPILGEELGLNVFDVLPTPYYQRKFSGYINDSKHLWWKMQAAIDVVNNENRPLVWIDDDLGIHNRVEFSGEVPSDTEVLFVAPYSDLGIQPNEIDVINAWIEGDR